MNQLFKLLPAIYPFILSASFALTSCGDSGPEEKVPVVTTAQVRNITARTAISGGNVTEDHDKDVSVRGVCWSTSKNPTTASNKTQDGSGTGSFESDITGLNINTTYYVRAYATNEAGTGYGNELSFTTAAVGLATVLTAGFTSVTLTAAILGGNITDDGGGTITQRGVCWSKNPNPTVNDNKTTDGGGPGTFTSEITGLEPGTKYYVCAYAVNGAGTSYGAVSEFTTQTVNANIVFNPALTYGSVADNEGNFYQTIQIDTRVWMAENLRTTKLNDGTPVAYVSGNSAWAALTTAAYCWPDGDPRYRDVYGALYNWYAVNTGKLCPAGWHMPTDADWSALEAQMGGASVAAGKLKETGTAHWIDPNTGADNNSGFTALPAGGRDVGIGGFYDPGYQGLWWTSTQNTDAEAWNRLINHNNVRVFRNSINKKNGFAVRCVKD